MFVKGGVLKVPEYRVDVASVPGKPAHVSLESRTNKSDWHLSSRESKEHTERNDAGLLVVIGQNYVSK